jgi:chaperonin GroES
MLNYFEHHSLDTGLPPQLRVWKSYCFNRVPTASQERSIMKIRPLHDRVIVKRLEEDRTSSGGIVIPDTAAEKPTRGKIIAVGKGRILENGEVRPCELNVGDRILFGKYEGTEVKLEGEEFLVMREADVMAVLDPK